MDPALPLVRIIVVQPSAHFAGAPALSFDREGDTLSALARLGDEAAIEVVRDLAGCVEQTRRGDADLVILDCGLDADAERILELHRATGPPVLFVARDEADEVTLEAFRRGAADCVRVGSDLAQLLPEVALEQIRRWRQTRERALLAKRVGDLQRYNENIIQNMNSALVVVDAEGRITFANQTAEAILRPRPPGLLGRAIWDWFRAARDEGSTLARTLREGVRFKGAETTIRHGDGRVIPVGISCAPIWDVAGGGDVEGGGDQGGETPGAVAIFQDLSEIKQLQQQVLQTEKMASIGQLAAGVAHEINNPMGFIHANLFQMSEYLGDVRSVWKGVEDLIDSVRTGSIEQARRAGESLQTLSRELDIEFVLADFSKAVRECQEGSERIRHIVRDLRDFSHQDTAERELADVNQCVDSTASIVWTMMKHSVVLEKEYGELPQVRCFPMQLKQVFMNLLVNAYQAILERIAGSEELGTIQIRTSVHRDGVRVTIRDTGAGIAPENLDRIFDPFFTTKQVGAGTGLGLSTSYNIVRRHGGTIRADSTLGEGTTFELWLPLDGSPPAEA